MRVSAPVTDYIRASTMNTQGDLVTRGALVPERLTAGLVNTFFRGKGAGVIPAYENLGEVLDTYLKAQGVGVDPIFEKLALRDTGVHVGNATRNSVGDQVITGVGYWPSIIIIIAHDTVDTNFIMSWGYANLSANQCIYIRDGGSLQDISTVKSIYIRRNVGNYLRGVVSALSTDGFTISWLLDGAVSAGFIYFCLP